jgi:hypothetical protein
MTASSGVPELAELILTAVGYEMNGMSALVTFLAQSTFL